MDACNFAEELSTNLGSLCGMTSLLVCGHNMPAQLRFLARIQEINEQVKGNRPGDARMSFADMKLNLESILKYLLEELEKNDCALK